MWQFPIDITLIHFFTQRVFFGKTTPFQGYAEKSCNQPTKPGHCTCDQSLVVPGIHTKKMIDPSQRTPEILQTPQTNLMVNSAPKTRVFWVENSPPLEKHPSIPMVSHQPEMLGCECFPSQNSTELPCHVVTQVRP